MPRMTDQFDLTDDQREIQALARRFTADRITQNAAEWDEKHIFPRDVIKEAADLGFAALYVSGESGGIAPGRLESALILEAMISEENTSDTQSLMSTSYDLFC